MANQITSLITKFIHNAFMIVCSAFFYSYSSQYLFSFQIAPLAPLCLPVLAVFFGFTALLYNRARAIPNGPEQRRTLYAAERALQATTLYFYALLTGSLLTAIFISANIDAPNNRPGEIAYPFALYFIPILLTIFAFGSFTFSLRAMAHRKIRILSIRDIMKKNKIKTYLTAKNTDQTISRILGSQIISPPLHQLGTVCHIRRSMVGCPNFVLLLMCQLSLNHIRVPTMLIRNG